MGVWPLLIAARDFVMINHIEHRPDGSISMLVYTDPEYQHLQPENKKYIRGECHVGGWLLEPQAGNKTKMTLMVELDLKGNLGQSILKKANTD